MLIVAEKPSVARAITRCVRTEAVALRGHILELDFKGEYSRWRSVDPKKLFHADVDWVVRDRKAYRALASMLKSHGEPIVMATDNDHEGELIAYEVLLIAQRLLGKPRYMRMRFNTVSTGELREAWSRLEPDLRWGWVNKALFRHVFDLRVGAAYTRLLTLSYGKGKNLTSYGSCQAPTLWFVYTREMERRSFRPETYYVVEATLNDNGVAVKVSTGAIKEESEAKRLYTIAKSATYATAESYSTKTVTERKPLPTDTDTMLQELTRILGVSGTRVMSLAERLYGDGFISYPRTETNMWVRVDHNQILRMLSGTPLSNFITGAAVSPVNGRKNDGAHPPIHPVKPYLAKDHMGKVWEYVARRYLANVVGEDAALVRWRLNVKLNGVPMSADGRYMVKEGFYRVFPYFYPKDLQQIPEVKVGDRLPVLNVNMRREETKPPPHLTESELLKLMEKNGIGTDATRHMFPTIIVERGYAVKRGRAFLLTQRGESLINLLASVEKRLVTPETRRYVEEMMGEVERGNLSLRQAEEKSIKIYEELYGNLALAIQNQRQPRG